MDLFIKLKLFLKIINELINWINQLINLINLMN